MKITLKCNLRGKSSVWRKGLVLEKPFPPEIEEELMACREGRADTLIIEEDEDEPDMPVNWTFVEGPHSILFREFSKPPADRVVYQKEEIQYDSNPWFLRERDARKKRQLLLRKF